MTNTCWPAHFARIAASLAIYWIICLAAAAVLYHPHAVEATGFFWAPSTFLVIGAIALPIELAGGSTAEPLWLVAVFGAGGACLLGGIFRPRWSWATLPGLCALGFVGWFLFSGGFA
jgi:hypothetical protein